MFIASFLSGIAVLLWLGLLAYVGYIVIQRSRGQTSRISVTVAVFILIAAGVVSTLSTSVVIIDAGEAGVVFNVFTGTQPGSLGPGLRLVAPYINQIYRYNIREQVYTMTKNPDQGESETLWSPTIEGLQVGIDSTTRYRVNPAKADLVHNQLRDDYVKILVRPGIRSIVRHHVSQNTVTDIYGPQRAQTQEQITGALIERFDDAGLELLSFDIRNVNFTEDYATAIEQKQIAQQQAEQMQFVLEKEQQEAERKIIEAEGVKQAAIAAAQGEAESLRLVNEQITRNKDLLLYRYIEKLSPNIRVMMVPSGNPFILNMESLQSQVETPAAP